MLDFEVAPISALALAKPLVFSLLYSIVISFIYRKFSRDLSDRTKFSNILVILAVTIAIIIQVIKGSLALSIGLVGALSIVRFRSPIKDPEQLVYLFVAIAIGIAVGAGEILFAGIATAFLSILIPLLSGSNWLFRRDTATSQTAHVVAKIVSNAGEAIDLETVSQFLTERKLEHLIKGASKGPEESSISIYFYNAAMPNVNNALIELQLSLAPTLGDVNFELWNMDTTQLLE